MDSRTFIGHGPTITALGGTADSARSDEHRQRRCICTYSYNAVYSSDQGANVRNYKMAIRRSNVNDDAEEIKLYERGNKSVSLPIRTIPLNGKPSSSMSP